MKILISIVFLVFFSCYSVNDTPPLDEEKFVTILVQMELIQAELSFEASIDQSVLNKNLNGYKSLFNRMKTDSAEVIKTFTYYQSKPNELLKIYETVRDSLKARGNKYH